MLTSLTDVDYRSKAEQELRKVFLNTDSHAPTFGSKVESVKILYEYLPPDASVVNAVVQAALSVGDNSMYLSVTNEKIIEDDSIGSEHWLIPFDDVPTYLSCNTEVFGFAYQLENVIYSPNGDWGLFYSFEKYGILAATESFMYEFSKALPSVDQQILDYLKFVRQCIQTRGIKNVDTSWIASLLKHVYGPDEARVLIEKSHLSSYIAL